MLSLTLGPDLAPSILFRFNKIMNKKFLLVFLTSYLICSYYAKTHYQNNSVVKPPIVPIEKVIPPTTPNEPITPKLEEPTFKNWGIVKNRINETSFYADIMNHASTPITGYDRGTNAHETTHQINAQIRNSLGTNYNAFYVGNNKSFAAIEPSIRKGQVAEFIPNSLRFVRFNLYVSGQTEWDKQPLYLIDEWISYLNGSKVDIEDLENKRYSEGWQDSVSGPLEFSIYCVALAMTIEKYDPSYWNSEKGQELKRFINWGLKESETIYFKGYKSKEFIWDKQEELLSNLQNSPEGKKIRDFISLHFSNVWLKH